MDFIQGEKFQKLANNKTIFYCHTHDVNDFFKKLDFEHEFILISHNSDYKITDKPTPTAAGHLLKNGESGDANIKYIPTNLKLWFGQNVDYISNKIIPIPIGLENHYNFPHLRKIEKLVSITKTKKHIKNLIYLNFNINTNPKERQYLYDNFKELDYVTAEYGTNGINYDNYLQNVYNHKFMLCPPGNGIDAHRPWEALYIGTIPIQVKNNNNLGWRELPICWLDNWEQLKDKNFLISEYNRIKSTNFDLSKLDMKYWEETINKSI